MAGKRKMFGEDKPVQRNKDNRPAPSKENRSPGRSNATKSRPSLREDVVESVRDDVGRIQRRNEPARTALGQEARRQAGVRATRRMVGRATAVGTTAMASYDLASAANDMFKISDKLVDAAGPSKAEKQVNLDYRKDSEMDKFKAGPKMDDEDGKRLRDINAHKWKGTM